MTATTGETTMATANEFVLYDYWRSSACYRVRIALNLKGVEYQIKPVHLVDNGGEQHSAEHHARNPLETVPVLMVGRRAIRQSMAIIEYLEETQPHPALLPPAPRERAQARALAQLIACDVHPLNNLRVTQYLQREFGADQAAREAWMRHWMEVGLRAFEEILVADDARGMFCSGDAPGIADICLVPQVYNALRHQLDLEPFPTIRAIYDHCMAEPEFQAARPENQPGAA